MNKRTNQLFARFQAIYGGRWTACYATEQSVDLAIAEWSEVIERMGDEQLQKAISWAKTSCPWPPSMAEFLHAGLGIDDELIRDTAIARMRRKGLPCHTYLEIDAASKLGRQRAVQFLVDEGLPILLNPPEPIGIDTWNGEKK